MNVEPCNLPLKLAEYGGWKDALLIKILDHQQATKQDCSGLIRICGLPNNRWQGSMPLHFWQLCLLMEDARVPLEQSG